MNIEIAMRDIPIEPITLKVVEFFNQPTAHLMWDIAIVGTGGVGGYILQSFMRMLKNFNINGLLTLADADYVEEKNLLRQNFIVPDVGKRKVEVLASRYSNVYDLDIRTVAEWIETEEAVERLFGLGKSVYDHIPYKQVQRVLIGAVDNNKTRQVFHRYFMKTSDLIYIDAGNDEVLPVSDSVTEEESLESGYSGQVVCGVKVRGKVILPPVGQLFANIMEESADDFFPSQSCGRNVVSFPQRMHTNLMNANVMLGYLNTLLYEGSLLSHFTTFNARNQVMMPQYITTEYLEKIKKALAAK